MRVASLMYAWLTPLRGSLVEYTQKAEALAEDLLNSHGAAIASRLPEHIMNVTAYVFSKCYIWGAGDHSCQYSD